MKTNLKHEFYKMSHQRSSWWSFIVLLGLMIYTAIPSSYITKNIISQGFGAGQWSIIIMIALSANFITMELRDNTMPILLYKSPNRQTVFLSKLLVLILYGLFLVIVGFVFALIIKAVLFNQFNWQSIYHHHTLINDLILNLAGVVIYLLFTITLALLLVSTFKSLAIVIVVGLFIGFLGANISGILMQAFPGIRGILAWNPLNMINIITQLANPSVVKISVLSNGELVVGNLLYTLIFLLTGIQVFKRSKF